MSDRWLTIAEAAKRVGVDPRTIRRYVTRDGLVQIAGRVSEAAVVQTERAARERAKAGRPVKEES